MYSQMFEESRKLAEGLCENEKVEKFASGAASSVVGFVVGATTVNPLLGAAASAATSGLSRSHSKEVARVAVDFGIVAAASVASIVAIPVLLVAGIWSAFTKD